MSAAAEPLMSLERVDIRRPGASNKTNAPRAETSAELGDTSSKTSQESDEESLDTTKSNHATGLRTCSGGELRSTLRSQSYIELDDDDQHVAQAKAALSWDEEGDLTDLPPRSNSIEENAQVNIHLGALLRSASQDN